MEWVEELKKHSQNRVEALWEFYQALLDDTQKALTEFFEDVYYAEVRRSLLFTEYYAENTGYVRIVVRQFKSGLVEGDIRVGFYNYGTGFTAMIELPPDVAEQILEFIVENVELREVGDEEE